jgi:ribose transport system permease protein
MKSKVLKSSIPYFGLILVIVLFAVLTGGKTLQPNNLKLIAEQSMTILISASGVIFVMTMGSLDISQGSILVMACYVAASLSGYNMVLAIIAGIAVGMGIGAINGLISAKGKVPSFIATICTMFIFRGLSTFLTTNFEPKIPFAIYSMDNFVVKVIVVAIIMVFGFILFNYTKFGRSVRAIGSGEVAAEYSGIKVTKIKIIVFILAGAMAGIAAFFVLTRTGSVTASTGNLLETNVMIALVLGGISVSGGSKSRFSAVLIGCILIAFLENGLVQIGADTVIQQLVKALVFLATIIATMDRSSTMVSK